MSFYEEMAEMTLEMITEFGQQITLKRTIGTEYDPETSSGGIGTIETQTVTCIILPASKGTVEAFDSKFKAGTLIESNLRALKIAAKGVEWAPGPGCIATFEGYDWTMIGMTPSSPAGTDIVYSASVMR